MTIHWFLSGDASVGSARIHGINVHNKLLALGYDSRIVCAPPTLRSDIALPFYRRYLWRRNRLNKEDRVLVQKLRGGAAYRLMATVRATAKVSYIDCDLPLKLHMATMASSVICPSEILQRMYLNAGLKNVHYIPDSPEVFRSYHGQPRQTYRCIWFGRATEERWDQVTHLKTLIATTPALKNWKLLTISDHQEADYPWNAEAFDRIHECDAVVIPCGREEQSAAKSSNRALQAMALSVPVLASPIPEYRKVITHGQTGYLCDADPAWIHALTEVAQNPRHRDALINAAHTHARQFHLDAMIQKWLTALTLPPPTAPA